jgi:hypothetical protein
MAAQRWEYKRVIIEVDTKPTEDKHFLGGAYYYYVKLSAIDWKDKEIKELGNAGWELVSAVPVTGGRAHESAASNWGTSYTVGICLLFKRLLA